MNLCNAKPGLFFVWDISYNEWLLVDVVQVQREDIIFAAHIHSVVVLIHAKDAIVSRVQQKGEVMSCAGRLQLYKETEWRNKYYFPSSCA